VLQSSNFQDGRIVFFVGSVVALKFRIPSVRAMESSGAFQPLEKCEHEVAVPLYFYKIILVPDQSTWKATAFILPNTDFKQPYDLKSYIASIERIETLTGIEFMPRMSASDRRKLMSEGSTMWP
jgi:hypothetical protein